MGLTLGEGALAPEPGCWGSMIEYGKGPIDATVFTDDGPIRGKLVHR